MATPSLKHFPSLLHRESSNENSIMTLPKGTIELLTRVATQRASSIVRNYKDGGNVSREALRCILSAEYPDNHMIEGKQPSVVQPQVLIDKLM